METEIWSSVPSTNVLASMGKAVGLVPAGSAIFAGSTGAVGIAGEIEGGGCCDGVV